MKKTLLVLTIIISVGVTAQKYTPYAKLVKEEVSYKVKLDTQDNDCLDCIQLYVKNESLSNKSRYNIAIYTTGGFGMDISSEFNNGATYHYGINIETDKIGLTYSFGAGLTNEDPTKYINGNSDNYTAGFILNNIGAYYIQHNSQIESVYYGAGIQQITAISTNPDPLVWVAPYGILGINKYYGYNNQFALKAELNIGMVSSVNIGWGIRF